MQHLMENMAGILKHHTHLHRKDIKGVSTYVVLRDAGKIFNTNGAIEVKGYIDQHPIEGVLQPKKDGSHWLTIKKEWREAIGKTIGDPVEISLERHVSTKSVNKVKK